MSETQALEWANRTNVNGAALAFLMALALGLLLLPRRWAPLTLMALACFVPAGQRLVLLTLDFSFLRILVLFGWLRIFVRQETRGFRLHALDLTLIAWVLAMASAFTLLRGTQEALIYQVGSSFDALGSYFLFRLLVKDWNDLGAVGAGLSFLALPVCLAFCLERATGRNLFSIFGGVPEFTDIREGRLRCQGAFGHPILAGCFWAAAWPLVAAGSWARGSRRFWSVIGSLCALCIVALTASSTPIVAAGLAALGGLFFVLRRYTRAGLLVAVALFLGLELAMRAPVWHLIARIEVIGGSTGWHRFLLIDETFNHFPEWWLLGASSTAHWGPGLTDLTNQYVLVAVQGGLLALLLFLGSIVLGFRAAGRAWRSAWPNRARVALGWVLGVSLFTQCVSFLGVSLFDQTVILWFLVLACLASLSLQVQPASGARARASSTHGRGSARVELAWTGARELPGRT